MPPLRSVASIAVLIALTGATAAAQRSDLRVQIPGWDLPVMLDTVAAKSPLVADREKVMQAIETVFAEYGLPVESLDATVGTAPNRRVTKTGRLGKAPISRYLDCGRGFNGNNADVYRVVIAAAAWPEPNTGDVAVLRVAIVASAQDPGGARAGYQLCGTRGRFEVEFASRVRAILEKGS